MIKIQQLIQVNALIKHCNFRKAAKTLHISHPAFSRSIASLEETLGVKLFHRHQSGVSATVYGQTVEKYAKQILTATEELKREIKIIKEGGLGELSVVLGPFVAELTGHKAIGKLLSESPDIRCQLLVRGWQEVERLVIERQVDLGLAELGQSMANPYIATEPLTKHQSIVFCRTGHPLLEKEKVLEADLRKFPLVMTKIPSRVASHVPGRLFHEPGDDQAFPSVMIEGISFSRQIIRESDAISIALPLHIETELENNVFSVVPYENKDLFTNYGFMYLRDRALSPIAIKFMGIIRELEKEISGRNSKLLKQYLL